MNPDQTCGTCAFREATPKDLKGGLCKHGPPGVVALPGKDALQRPAIHIKPFYPPVRCSDVGCGRYKKETPPKTEDV